MQNMANEQEPLAKTSIHSVILHIATSKPQIVSVVPIRICTVFQEPGIQPARGQTAIEYPNSAA
jgi:hypothetical protein